MILQVNACPDNVMPIYDIWHARRKLFEPEEISQSLTLEKLDSEITSLFIPISEEDVIHAGSERTITQAMRKISKIAKNKSVNPTLDIIVITRTRDELMPRDLSTYKEFQRELAKIINDKSEILWI